jgi:hypothetical protein
VCGDDVVTGADHPRKGGLSGTPTPSKR